MIEVGFDHRVAGVLVAGDRGEDLFEGVIGMDGDDLRPRDHDLVGLDGAEFEGAPGEEQFGRREEPGAGAGLDHDFQFLGVERSIAAARAVDTEGPHNGETGGVEGPDNGPEDRAENAEGPRYPEGHALG